MSVSGYLEGSGSEFVAVVNVVDDCILNSVILRILAEPMNTVSDPDSDILRDPDPIFCCGR